MRIVPHHALGKVGGFARGHLVGIKIRVCGEGIVGTGLSLGDVDDKFAVRTPCVVLISAEGFLRAIECLALHNVFSGIRASIFRRINEKVAIRSILPLIPMPVAQLVINMDVGILQRRIKIVSKHLLNFYLLYIDTVLSVRRYIFCSATALPYAGFPEVRRLKEESHMF
jgi:hypothetical protein